MLPWQAPYVTASIPPLDGELRSSPEDFVVEEIPAYLPCGEGEHLYLKIEKRGIPTFAAIERIASAFDVPRHAVGYAGLKDANAVTVQWLSVATSRDAAAGFEMDGVRVIESARHRNKLKVGHLRGNRFRIRVRNVRKGGLHDAEVVMRELERRGVPNWFGPQRFGDRGDTHLTGRALLAAGSDRSRGPRIPDRRLRRLFLSAVQAECFNAVLDRRLKGPGYDRIVSGDLAWLHRNGACFRVEVATDVERARAETLEISPSGPLFGSKCTRPSGEALAMEEAVLTELGLTHAAFEARPELEGARRPLRVPMKGSVRAPSPTELDVEIELPPGAYATIVLREVMKNDRPPAMAGDAVQDPNSLRLKDGDEIVE